MRTFSFFLVQVLFLLYCILGWSGSVVRRSQRSSDLTAQLQALLKDYNEAEFLPGRCDTAAIAALVLQNYQCYLIRQLAQEIRELTLSNPAVTFNCNCSCNGSYASYLLPAAALLAVGFCYMWCKGWSFSDVISVTKQLENLPEKIDSARGHLTEKLEVLSLKVEEQNELNQLNANDVNEMKLKLSQIQLEATNEKISGMDEKLKLAESKQDMTIAAVWRLGQITAESYEERDRKISEGVSAEQGESSTLGLQMIGEEGTSSKTVIQRPYQIKVP
ncbi:uncharacterized protein LOC114715249 isoform X2 [Neltuma alba]|uniref:uncharacterized protein LOC114715249 isoform X2 n=1 Tax=Neltuma alba TaxID=207710 RepID=UPI0010A3276B|nr:uncharacterized protein LOC114715249 isoform X2 [Prosopis alba]